MVCVVLGGNVPSPENVKVACMSFIGVIFGYGERSWWIGWGENSILEDDDEGVVVAVVLPAAAAVTS